MKIDEGILFLNQMKLLNPNLDLRIVIPFKDVEETFDDTIAHYVLEKTAWGENEVNFFKLKNLTSEEI